MIYCKNIMNVTLCFFTFPRFWNHFFFLHFRQCHCHNCYNFFFPISAMTLPQLVCQIFFFFSFSLWALHAHLTPGQQNWAKEFRYPRCQNSTFSLSTFFFFSLILLVEFRQWQYRNSVSLFRIPNKFQQFL